jgi:CRISPR-associated protein Cas1
METLFVSKDAKLERRDSTIIVRTNGSVRRFPAETLNHVVLLGEAGLTSALLGLCGRSGIRVTVLDWHGNVAGSFDPFNAPQSGHVRLARADHILDTGKRMVIARESVSASLENILSNLRYRAWRGNDRLGDAIGAIRVLSTRITPCRTSAELMGVEGSARAAYYEAWPLVDPNLAFAARRRRPPNNRINCLISWFNGLAYAAMRHEIGKTHLEPAFSFLHGPATARYSLALDLSEPFKPAVVDTLIFELVMRERLADAWFVETDGVCRLTETGRRATLESWVSKIETPGASGTSMRDEPNVSGSCSHGISSTNSSPSSAVISLSRNSGPSSMRSVKR